MIDCVALASTYQAFSDLSLPAKRHTSWASKRIPQRLVGKFIRFRLFTLGKERYLLTVTQDPVRLDLHLVVVLRLKQVWVLGNLAREEALGGVPTSFML